MLALLGGKYDGRYLDRPSMPEGSTVAIIDGGGHEVYRMGNDGTAEFVGQFNDAWDAAALVQHLSS